MIAEIRRDERMEETAEIYRTLAAADAAGRQGCVLGLLEEQRGGSLRLPARDGVRALLDGIDLGREHLRPRFEVAAVHPVWWDHGRQAIDLRRADLRGASLRHANLHGAVLEEANFEDADLAGAILQGADLAEANLQNALLEDADLRKANLRFVRGHGSVLEKAHLQGADLWGADVREADFSGADLQGATLEEADLQGANLSGVDLRGANLKRANLRGVNLRGADLRGAALSGANFAEAVLRDVKLQEVDLVDCTLTHVHTSGGRFEKTRLEREQLGGAIGEELAGEYGLARRGYLALERNFEELGDHNAARWAYLRRRRAEKWEAFGQAKCALRERRWQAAAVATLKFVGDQTVELVCNYGESVLRVIGTLLVVYLAFACLYGITGSVVRVESTAAGEIRTRTHNPVDLGVFSLMAMTTSSAPPSLQTCDQSVYFLTGIQALVGIALTGLLGFVAGNRIRR